VRHRLRFFCHPEQWERLIKAAAVESASATPFAKIPTSQDSSQKKSGLESNLAKIFSGNRWQKCNLGAMWREADEKRMW